MQHSSELSPLSPSRSDGLLFRALSFGIVLFYVLFTLLPNSHSLMVKWPWVFLWQFGLMLGPIMLLFQVWRGDFRRLGARLDWIAIAWAIALVLSAAFAEFTHQAFWCTWAALCSLSFLYVVNAWLTSANCVRKLLIFQGLLSTIFSAYSLIAWLWQTVRPQLAVLDQLKGYGIERRFDLTELTLRNWHPIGHQNYVAGYLILSLPLLVGLAFSTNGRIRFAWMCSGLLSLATLYTTASRAGFLGLATSVFVFAVIAVRCYPKTRKKISAVASVSLVAIVLWGVSSDRIRDSVVSIFTVDPTVNPSYRAITNATGWFMGLDHPILGAGLGSVTLLYQKYRPTWANGSESELTYQLHSTPAQLWAELGLIGIGLTLLTVIAIAVLSIRCHQPQHSSQESAISLPLLIGLISGLAGYIIYAITDYQLDNTCISGTIVIYLSVLISTNKTATKLSIPVSSKTAASLVSKRITFIGAGFIVAISIWLYPIHRAWMLSSQGFLALQQEDVPSFVAYLEKAHQLAPWESYYAYQLGWNLGEIAFQSEDVEQKAVLAQESVKWFEKAIALSPNREFGYSNLGWLLVNTEPEKATVAFWKATELVPDKKGAYFALGYGLFKEGKSDLAIKAMVIELMRQPLLLTSPIWRSAELSALYSKILNALESELLSDSDNEDVDSPDNNKRQQMLGMLYWWEGDNKKANEVLPSNALNQALVELAELSVEQSRNQSFNTGRERSDALIAAWQRIPDSADRLLKAMLSSDANIAYIKEAYYTELLSNINASINKSSNFHQWLTQSAPARSRRNQRLGFGTISRHIDGPLPKDFSIRLENTLINNFSNAAFPFTMPKQDIELLVKSFSNAMLLKS